MKLSDIQGLTLNGLTSQLIFAGEVFENIYQGAIELNEKGCTRKYSTKTDGSAIQIAQVLPLPIEAREIGASVNGANFPQYTYQPTSRDFLLNLITVIDDMVDIPQVRIDMLPIDVMRANLKNISDKVVLNENAIKIAARLFTAYTEKQGGKSIYETSFNSASDKFIDALPAAVVDLDDGDEDYGIAMFPRENSIAVVRTEAQKWLLSSASGVVSLGGANYGYDIAQKGGVDHEASPRRLNDGYIGDFAGVPVHVAASMTWSLAEKYLGFPKGTFSGVLGYVANAKGNFFGMAGNEQLKTIDSPSGVGIRLQPLYRMGAANPIAKSNSYIVKSGFVNPYGLQSVFSSGVSWSYLAPGSRSSHSLVLDSSASTKLTATDAGAVAIKCVIVSTSGADVSVGGFLSAIAGGASATSLTSGTEATISGFTSGKTAIVLSVSADGTVVVGSKAIA